jgi:hypothetical protein
MKKITRALVLAVGCLVAVALSACGSSGEPASNGHEPADVVPIKGTDLSRIKLTAEAAKRVGIQTAAIEPVAAKGKSGRLESIPYSAVLYGADGKTFAYTNPRRLVYVRAPITVADIKGNSALLSSGPPVGTTIVTVGAPELYGTEFGVEE